MNEDRSQRLQRLFSEASGLARTMRPAYLAEVCAGDNELRRDVELLLERAESRTESISYRYAKLTVGTQLGPYRVETKIGEGGMGEVWKARDTRLDRVVALKTSKEGFSERFAREARAVAALNHPHVCHLYDVGSNYLVMEYIEGTPLKGPLPLDKAFAFSDQILDALTAAHRKGITHRDLKPSNVLVTAGGIKLLDFGLAKQAAKTETEALTGATAPGQIVGTLQYMAPEQLRGEETDARTDLFAFGCVLYELISGKPAFAAENQAGVIAKILERDPEPLEIPKPIERILNTCLAKDPTDRFQTAVDLRRNLRWARDPAPETGDAPPRRNKPIFWIAAVVSLAMALGTLALIQFNDIPVGSPLLQATLEQPANGRIAAAVASATSNRLALIVVDAQKGAQLWVRSLDGLENVLLPGTEGASDPFWSPNGKYIAFFASGKLKKIAVTGGPAITLCDAVNPFGGTWNSADTIVFASNPGGLKRIQADVGTAVTMTTTASDSWPRFLPDGRRLIFVRRAGGPVTVDGLKPGTYLLDLDRPEANGGQLLLDNAQRPAQYAPPFLASRDGYLLFWRESSLIAQPVDPETLKFTGDSFVVAEGPLSGRDSATPFFSVSEDGVLVYFNGAPERQLTWYDREGNNLGSVGKRGSFGIFRLSPDDRRLVLERSVGTTRASDVWVMDLKDGAEEPMTLDSTEAKKAPAWTSDGSIVYNNVIDNQPSALLRRSIDRSGMTDVLYASTAVKNPSGWFGSFLIFTGIEKDRGNDIKALRVGAGGNEEPTGLVETLGNDRFGTVSPDGRWLAYDSNKSGRFEVYLRPFLPAGAEYPASSAESEKRERRVSHDGGTQALWRADSHELFYVVPQTGKLMAVEVNGDKLSTPKTLFQIQGDTGSAGVNWFVVRSDGQRFLVAETQKESWGVRLVVNWQMLSLKATH